MDDGVEGAKRRSRARKVMGQGLVGGMGSGRTSGKAGDMMPAQPQIAPHRPTHKPTCASYQDLHPASNILPLAERKDRVSRPPRLLPFKVWGSGIELFSVSIYASRGAALHLKGGRSGTAWPFRAAVTYKGYQGQPSDGFRTVIAIIACHLDRPLRAAFALLAGPGQTYPTCDAAHCPPPPIARRVSRCLNPVSLIHRPRPSLGKPSPIMHQQAL